MEYFIQADFKVSHYYPLPEGMTLCDFQNHEIVKNYNVKWDTLYILYGDNTEEKVKPKEDPDSFNFFKRPEVSFPISKADNGSFYQVDECVCFKCMNEWNEDHYNSMMRIK